MLNFRKGKTRRSDIVLHTSHRSNRFNNTMTIQNDKFAQASAFVLTTLFNTYIQSRIYVRKIIFIFDKISLQYVPVDEHDFTTGFVREPFALQLCFHCYVKIIVSLKKITGFTSGSLPVHFRLSSGSLPVHLGFIDGHMCPIIQFLNRILQNCRRY